MRLAITEHPPAAVEVQHHLERLNTSGWAENTGSHGTGGPDGERLILDVGRRPRDRPRLRTGENLARLLGCQCIDRRSACGGEMLDEPGGDWFKNNPVRLRRRGAG